MAEALVTIQNLSKSFNKKKSPALDSISAELFPGRIIGLVGPDGAGKTTLIRLMAGLLKPTEGTVSVGGFDTIRDAESIHKMIGYMPQKFGLYEDLSVMQNMTLYADLQGLHGAERDSTFKKLMDFTKLQPFTDRLANNLSGGMKQKLGLACSLLCRPKLLLLDEPSVGVDPIARRELWKMTADLAQEGITIVWSTSYLDEAERCRQVLLLNEGKLLFNGPPEDLTSHLQGRTYQIQHITTRRRVVLVKALKDPAIIDGVIQGSAVRIVLKSGAKQPDIRSFEAGSEAVIVAVKPRFEDAFVDMLGGGPGGDSPVADKMKPLKEYGSRDTLIEAKNLTKRFGNFVAADQISFDVKRGEIFGLLGPNGAGKSTTFKMLCGLIRPTSGEAIVTGLSLAVAPSQARARIGYMAQKFSLYDTLSVMQNLNFFSGIYPVELKDRNRIINEMVESFALAPYLDASAGLLPLGFKQRLALSCAIMHQPEVLFLDEPTSGVDPVTRREFWNHINGFVEKGVTVMVTTHFMEEAEYCDRIGLINQGKLLTIGSPDELKERVRSETLPSPTLEDAFIMLSK